MEFVFLDLDQTILDFEKASVFALSAALGGNGLEPTQAVLDRYHAINRWHWEQLELGKLSREEVLVGRFRKLFQEMGLSQGAEACAHDYEFNLSLGAYFLPGAQAAMEALHSRYKLYLASNGTAFVQHRRMKDADLYRFFDGLFISEEVGYNKPSKEFFEAAFAAIPGFRRDRAIMVGDSLSSDILGGINAGIRTVWINPLHRPETDIHPDYTLESIAQLPELLEKL